MLLMTIMFTNIVNLDGSHNLMSLEELAESVTDSVEALRVETAERIRRLSDHSREINSALDNWDGATKERLLEMRRTKTMQVV